MSTRCSHYLWLQFLPTFAVFPTMTKVCLCQNQENLFHLSSHSTTFYSKFLPHSQPDSPCIPYFITWEALQSSPTLKILEKDKNVSRTDQNFQQKTLCILCWLLFLFYFSIMNSVHGEGLVHPDKLRSGEKQGCNVRGG